MKLADTGLTVQDIKDKASKYMIETYERFDFLAETAKEQFIYDEKGEAYLDFYAGIAVNSAGNCNEKVVEAVVEQAKTLMHILILFRRHCWRRKYVQQSAWTKSFTRIQVQRRMRL